MRATTSRGKVVVCQSMEDIPDVSRLPDDFTLYSDAETDGLHAYNGNRACGWSVSWDQHDTAYYLPIRHASTGQLALDFSGHGSLHNLPVSDVTAWMSAANRKASQWVNHHVTFDAHFLQVDGGDVCRTLVDTATLIRVLDGCRRYQDYSLKVCAKRFLTGGISEAETVRDAGGLKNGAAIFPIEMIGPYAAEDVFICRDLADYIRANITSGILPTIQLEIDLARILFEMERDGVAIDTGVMEDLESRYRIELDRSLYEFSRHYPDHDPVHTGQSEEFLYSVMHFPVLQRTNKGKPSADAKAVKQLLRMMEATPDGYPEKDFIAMRAMLSARKASTFLNLYVDGWRKLLTDDNRLHTHYRQVVDTGRMASSAPNLQNVTGDAKRMVVPDGEGFSLITRDYAQLEFMVIAAVCGCTNVIDEYIRNPNADFHAVVADLCGVIRPDAKTVNFGVSFGMGEELLEMQLRAGGSKEDPKEILRKYNAMLPGIKSTKRKLVKATRRLAGHKWGEFGTTETMVGRIRKLRYYPFSKTGPDDETRKALNSVVQGLAADIAKRGLRNIHRSATLKNAGVTPRLIVHDDITGHGRTEAFRDPAVLSAYETAMTHTGVHLAGIPLRVSGTESNVNWKEAS